MKMNMTPGEVLVFPLNTPNEKIVDLKQLLAAQASYDKLKAELEGEAEFGEGFRRLLEARATECLEIVAKIKEKYKDKA